MEMNEFKDIKVWAVIGNIHDKTKYANKIFYYLKNKGYVVYPVDPTGIEVDKERTFTSLSSLPEIPEAIDMVINPVRGINFIQEAHELNIKNVWLQPGAQSEEIVELAKTLNMNVIQNKCVMVDL